MNKMCNILALLMGLLIPFAASLKCQYGSTTFDTHSTWPASCPTCPNGRIFDSDAGYINCERQGGCSISGLTKTATCKCCMPGYKYWNQGHLLKTKNEGAYGKWGDMKRCPRGSHIKGISMLAEKPGGDDAAALSIEAICTDGTILRTNNYKNGPVDGTWNTVTCPKAAEGQLLMNGFQTKVEGVQDGGDDTALNSVRIYCFGEGNSYLEPSNAGQWGTWSSVVRCPRGQFACGVAQKIEAQLGPGLGGGDDTGLNAVRFGCC